MGILFGVFQKVETCFLGTLEKSILESCQESSMLWWDTFSYCYMFDRIVGKILFGISIGESSRNLKP
jgi:hypothetical protein